MYHRPVYSFDFTVSLMDFHAEICTSFLQMMFGWDSFLE